MTALAADGFSYGAMCPDSGITSSCDLGIAEARDLASAGGVITSCSPTRTSVGTVMPGKLVAAIGTNRHSEQCPGDSTRRVVFHDRPQGFDSFGTLLQGHRTEEFGNHAINKLFRGIGRQDRSGRWLRGFGRPRACRHRHVCQRASTLGRARGNAPPAIAPRIHPSTSPPSTIRSAMDRESSSSTTSSAISSIV